MKLGIFLYLLLVSAIAAAGQTPAPSPIAGRESKMQREVFDAAKYPALTAVGRVSFIGQSWCTIVLVAEDIAVTAGHCVLKANYKFDLSKDFDPFWTTISFKPDGARRLENVSIKRVLTAKINPDYAIVRLNRKIPASEIKPLKVAQMTLAEMRADETRLGCAGFNGDKDLGGGGFLLTLSRNIKIIPENSTRKRIDTSCFSTYGSSGGLFYRERTSEEKSAEYDFLGIVWGMTDEKYNERGELVKDENIVTSITPVSAFYKDLTKFIGVR